MFQPHKQKGESWLEARLQTDTKLVLSRISSASLMHDKSLKDAELIRDKTILSIADQMMARAVFSAKKDIQPAFSKGCAQADFTLVIALVFEEI